MNRFEILEKIAEKQGRRHTALDAAGLGTGAYLTGQAYHRGHLTGRETLYHGTSEANAEKIKQEGIIPRKSPGIIDYVEGEDKGKLNSDNLTFMEKRRLNAHSYAVQQEAMEGAGGPHVFTRDPKDLTKRLAKSYVRDTLTRNNRNIVRVNAPTWKIDEFNKTVNPEWELRKKNLIHKILPKPMQKMEERDFEKMVFTNKGTVSPKYVKGSPHYEANSLKEIQEFIKTQPRRFIRKGLGRVGLGSAAAGLATYDILKHRSNEKK